VLSIEVIIEFQKHPDGTYSLRLAAPPASALPLNALHNGLCSIPMTQPLIVTPESMQLVS
jgi:hypothetical protein